MALLKNTSNLSIPGEKKFQVHSTDKCSKKTIPIHDFRKSFFDPQPSARSQKFEKW